MTIITISKCTVQLQEVYSHGPTTDLQNFFICKTETVHPLNSSPSPQPPAISSLLRVVY